LCERYLFLQSDHPGPGQVGNFITDRSWPAVKLGRCRRKETAPAKYDSFHVPEPMLQHGVEAWQTPRTLQGWLHHLLQENLLGGFDCRKLKLFFGTKVGEDSGLAHL